MSDAYRAVESAIEGSKDHSSGWVDLLRHQLADTARYLTPPRKPTTPESQGR